MLTCYVNRPDRETKWGKCEALRKVSRKKVAVLLDFVQMRGVGEGPAQIFVHFSQTVYIGSIWGWSGRGRPLPKFLGTLMFKKSGTRGNGKGKY